MFHKKSIKNIIAGLMTAALLALGLMVNVPAVTGHSFTCAQYDDVQVRFYDTTSFTGLLKMTCVGAPVVSQYGGFATADKNKVSAVQARVGEGLFAHGWCIYLYDATAGEIWAGAAPAGAGDRHWSNLQGGDGSASNRADSYEIVADGWYGCNA